MKGEELLKVLEAQGLLTEAAAARLARESLLSNTPVEDLLYRNKAVDDRKVAEVKSASLKIPYRKVDLERYDEKLLEFVPEETARTYGVAPLEKKDNLLVVGMVSPDDLKAQEALKFIARQSHMNLGVFLISFGDWQGVLQKYSPYRTEIEKAVQSLGLKPGERGGKRIRIEEIIAGEEEAPIIRVVASTFEEAVARRASDIHIEPLENHLRIRFRIDGELGEVAVLPPELAQPVVSRIKVISNLKIDETRIPQDGRFRTRIFDRDIDFRVSTLPTPLGEKVAIRVLDPTVGLQSFDSLGLAGKNLEIVKEGLGRPYGMILVTGPTGSGKTTTLYALLQTQNREKLNIVSLEDPVEYLVPGINQSQVQPEIHYDFASGLRQILRQDPDVIMVGEIRDNETAGLAVQAALTGHIVLSTLHTNNAVGAIPRLIDMKVEPFLLPLSLNLMMAQRLVGVLCDHCRVPEEAPPPIQKVIKKTLGETPPGAAPEYREPYKIYHAPGCPKCKGKGIMGRMGIFEVFHMTPALEEVINTELSAQKILNEARNQGMLTLRQDGIMKALAGLVSVEEVLRETEDA